MFEMTQLLTSMVKSLYVLDSRVLGSAVDQEGQYLFQAIEK